jgi:hypothetical protein
MSANNVSRLVCIVVALSAGVAGSTAATANANVLLTEIDTNFGPTSLPQEFVFGPFDGQLGIPFTASYLVANFGAHDTAEADALTASLSDGQPDTVVFLLGSQLVTAPESLFQTSGPGPLPHFAELDRPTAVDWSGLRIDSYTISLLQADSNGSQVQVRIYGGVPEPSSAALLAIGGVAGLVLIRRAGRRN